MPESSRHDSDRDRGFSRRALIRGGLSVAAGAAMTILAAQAGSAAVTPMDVARVQPTTVADAPAEAPVATPAPATGWTITPGSGVVIPSIWSTAPVVPADETP